MEMDFKTLADYVPVMVAVVGVANTLAKYLLKKGSPENLRAEAEEGKSDTLAEGKSDLDLITAQLDDILCVLKEIAREGKRQAELDAYLERCREEKKGIE